MILPALGLRLTFSRGESEREKEEPLEPFTRNTHITPGSRGPPLDFNGTNVAKPHRRPFVPLSSHLEDFDADAISTTIIPQNSSGVFFNRVQFISIPSVRAAIIRCEQELSSALEFFGLLDAKLLVAVTSSGSRPKVCP